jgi:small subunit ribosomal protein S1
MSAPTTIDELTRGMELRGTVKRIELFGAFVDIGIGQDALLHISQLGQKVRNVDDVVNVGDEITVYVLKVDKESNRIALTMTKPPAVSWDSLKEGDMLEGEVVRVETFGAFIDVGAERPGMVHVSELAEGYVKAPSDVVKVGDKVQARVIKVNRKKRQIDLSMKAPEDRVEAVADEPEEDLPTAMALALRKAMQQSDEDVEFRTPSKRDKRKQRDTRQAEVIARTLRDHANS